MKLERMQLLLMSILCILAFSSLWAKYIDNHTHIACFGYKSDCYVSKTMKDSFKFYGYQYIFGLSEKKAQTYGDQILFKILDEQIQDSKWVDQAVLLAMDQVYSEQGKVLKDKTVFYIPNDYISENIKKYNTFLFGASVHPYRKDALKELEKVKANGAVLVKLLPAIQKFDIKNPLTIEYFKKLKKLNLPLLIHVDDESAFSKSHKESTFPYDLEIPLKLGVTVICAHAASAGQTKGKDNFEIFIEFAKKYPNLYADISGLVIKKTRFGHLERVLKHKEIYGQLIYGSDFPLSSQVMSSPFYYRARLGFFNSIGMSFTTNTWDRDVELKKALGVPESIFENSRRLLLQNQKANL